MEALRALQKRAEEPPPFRKAWIEKGTFPKLDAAFARTGKEQSITLAASIDEVQAFLAERLKPGRKLLSAVRFSDGEVRETWQTDEQRKAEEARVAAEEASYRENAKPPEAPKEETSARPPTEVAPKSLEVPKKPEVATTVAAPVRGCPAPDFPEADVRANRVLDAFLTDEQREDWARYGKFVQVGAMSGHRYMLVSRDRPALLAKYGGRCLYDLEERFPICTHDWDVPSAEEILALRLFLEIPGGERYLRTLPEEHIG